MNIKVPLLIVASSLIISSGVQAGDYGKTHDSGSKISADSSGTVLPGLAEREAYIGADIDGTTIENTDGDLIGDIDRVVKDKTGNKLVVIGLSGSLKEVAVPFDELKWKTKQEDADQRTLVINATMAELEDKKDIDPFDYEELDADEFAKHEFSRFEEEPSLSQ